MSDIRKMQVLRVTQALARIQLDQAADVEVLLDVTTDQMITKIKLTIPTELALMERVAALIAERDTLKARIHALETYVVQIGVAIGTELAGLTEVEAAEMVRQELARRREAKHNA